MTQAIIDMLCRIRKHPFKTIAIDNDNRHKITVKTDGGEEAYFFSSPIVSLKSGQIVPINFVERANSEYYLEGTNCNILINSNEIIFYGINDTVRVRLNGTYSWKKIGDTLISDDLKISATSNGVLIHKQLIKSFDITLCVSSENHANEIRANSKYFAIMERQYVPSFVVSAIGVVSDNQDLTPVLVEHSSDVCGHSVTVRSTDNAKGTLVFEMNMYEHKLIQDTTVEIKRSEENNAFGGVAFLGKSLNFGLQRLYMKIDYVIINELNRRRLKNIKLYIPTHRSQNIDIKAYEMNYRFCSFGSTWKNKVLYGKQLKSVEVRDGFCVVDLSDTMIDNQNELRYSNGILIRVSEENEKYCVLSTGDSSAFSPILEVKYFD